MTLYILVYSGMLAKGDSVALVKGTSFGSLAQCEAVGKQLKPLVNNTAKELVFVCTKN